MENKYTGFLKGRRELYEGRKKCPPTGDILPLQFINTLYRPATDRKDYMENYDCFLDWALDTGIVDEATYNTLCTESYCYFHESEGIFEQVISFRECLRDLVHSLMRGEAPAPEYVGTFNHYFEDVKKHRSLNMNGYGMLEIWVNTNEQIAFPLWIVVDNATKFLTANDGSYIKKCQCGNLYIDRTKNGKRRWCSQANCGTMHWSKEYYKRKKELVGI